MPQLLPGGTRVGETSEEIDRTAEALYWFTSSMSLHSVEPTLIHILSYKRCPFRKVPLYIVILQCFEIKLVLLCRI